MPRPDARRPLLDAAERLFAEHGLAQVSDRQVADAAGNGNHSAVRYYFGGRAGLVQALLERHEAEVEPRQRELFERSDSLVGDMRALVIPLTDALERLPEPSWRARFLDQAVHDPSTLEIMRANTDPDSTSSQIVASAAQRLAHLDRGVVETRARLTAHVISRACAEIERTAHESGEPARWGEVGHFLCDALAGMLAAPISPVSD